MNLANVKKALQIVRGAATERFDQDTFGRVDSCRGGCRTVMCLAGHIAEHLGYRLYYRPDTADQFWAKPNRIAVRVKPSVIAAKWLGISIDPLPFVFSSRDAIIGIVSRRWRNRDFSRMSDRVLVSFVLSEAIAGRICLETGARIRDDYLG